MTGHPDDVQLSRLVDGDLSLTSREAVIAHLRLCPSCSERHDQLVAVAATLRLEPPLRWTREETDSVLHQLPQRRHRVRVAVAGGVSLVMCGLVVVEAAPLIAAMLGLVGVLIGLSGALTPSALAAGGPQLLVAVAAIAILAPLAAYPLARWR
jgi:anti-sigma factor RsiW